MEWRRAVNTCCRRDIMGNRRHWYIRAGIGGWSWKGFVSGRQHRTTRTRETKYDWREMGPRLELALKKCLAASSLGLFQLDV